MGAVQLADGAILELLQPAEQVLLAIDRPRQLFAERGRRAPGRLKRVEGLRKVAEGSRYADVPAGERGELSNRLLDGAARSEPPGAHTFLEQGLKRGRGARQRLEPPDD